MATLQERLRARFAGAGKPTTPGVGTTPPPTGPGGTPVTPGKAGGQAPAQGLRQALTSKVGQGAMKLAKGVGKLVTPVAIGSAGVSALRSYNTPTDVYAKRYGEQAGEGVMKDLGIRARGVGEDIVNTLNPFSSDTFGTGADKPVSPVRAKLAPVDTSGDQMKVNAATYAEGTEKPLGQITPDTGLRSRIVQDGKNSFSDGGQSSPDIGKKGGGLSIIGRGMSLEDTLAAGERDIAAARDLNKSRAAAAEGMSREDYDARDARVAQRSEIANLVQGGLSEREATARVFDRNAALDAEAAKGGGAGLSASDQISLANHLQRGQYQDASLGLRRDQFKLNEEQVGDQKDAGERNVTNKYIDQLNSEDEGVASATRGQLLQKFEQSPSSPEGQLLLSQAAQALNTDPSNERGPIDFALGGVPQRINFAADDFTLEENFFGEKVGGTIVKDKNGNVVGNLKGLKPEYQEAIRKVYAAKQQNQGLRR